MNQDTVNMLEGETFVMDVLTSDAEGDAVIISLSGSDASLFSLSGSALNFIVAPDFEKPNSEAGTNVYNISLGASDDINDSSQDIKITVIDATEGRVVDAPLSGAMVFIDTNGNLIKDADEVSVTTDKAGFFKLPVIASARDQNLKLVSLGGTDISTGNKLSDLALVSDMPSSLHAAVVVTPISTILSFATTPADKQAVLSALGITGTVEDVLTKDAWALAEKGNEEAIKIQKANQAIATVLYSATSLMNDSAADSSTDTTIITEFIYNQMVTLALSGDYLFDVDILSNVFQQGLSEYSKAYNLGLKINAEAFSAVATSEVISAVATSVATVIVILEGGSATEPGVVEVMRYIQDNLQEEIATLATTGDIHTFTKNSHPRELFVGSSSEAQPVIYFDLDKDGTVNFSDKDIDGDGFDNTIDRFPFDENENVDTDADGIGDNADNDDDNDGVDDKRDPAPSDYSLTPPTAVIKTDVSSGSAPLRVAFRADSSVAGNPAENSDIISSIKWNTGDGVTSSDKFFKHIYRTSGDYTISLTVKNSDGYSHTETYLLSVSAAQETLTIAGTISIPSTYIADSDTNNPDSNATSNNTLELSQEISLPAIISGYVNQPGHGVPGSSKLTGDTDDYYKINALGKEVINLIIGDTASGDLDLYAYDAHGSTMYSLGYRSPYESIQLPEQAGTYYIRVKADSGASTYTLDIGARRMIFSHGWNSSANFVENELIVQEKQDSTASAILQASKTLGVSKAHSRSSNYRGPMLYKLDAFSAQSSSSATKSTGLTSSNLSTNNSKLETLLKAKEMMHSKQFKYVEPNFLLTGSAVPNDPLYSDQSWHYKQINMPEAWDISTGTGNKNEVKVAILDTGILINHPDLEKRITKDGYDFVRDDTVSGDDDTVDPDPSDPGDAHSENKYCPYNKWGPESSSFHGTHVAGTVGASGNNNIGVTGVNWDVDIMPIRVLGCSGGTTFDVNQGLLYAAGLPNDYNLEPHAPADIINLSLGGWFPSWSAEETHTKVRNAGVIQIAAAGNDGNWFNFTHYPASYPGVISVGATNYAGQRAGYSTYNNFVDIAAPGGSSTYFEGHDVMSTHAFYSPLTTNIQPQYSQLAGTSMATPHVAGVASLMKGIYPDLSPADLDAVIASGKMTVDIGDYGYDIEYGYGLLDAKKALETAQSLNSGRRITPPPILSLTSYLAYIGATTTKVSIQAVNEGGGSLSIIEVTPTANEISIAPPDDPNGLGVYVISVDRANLPAGMYSESVRFISNTGTKILTLIYEKLESDAIDPDGGKVYALLYNIETDTVEKQMSSTASSGAYSFSIDEIDPAVYTLIAGSDIDNDCEICGAGEACAIWPNHQEPDYLVANQSFANLEMALRYETPIQAKTHSALVAATAGKELPPKAFCRKGQGVGEQPKIRLSSHAKQMIKR